MSKWPKGIVAVIAAVVLSIVFVGSASATLFVSDDFDRANASDLGSGWDYFSREGNPAGTPNQDDPTFEILANQAHGIIPPGTGVAAWHRAYYHDYELFSESASTSLITVESKVRSSGWDGLLLHQYANPMSGQYEGLYEGYYYYICRATYSATQFQLAILKVSSTASLQLAFNDFGAGKVVGTGVPLILRATTDNAGHLTLSAYEMDGTTLIGSVSGTDTGQDVGGLPAPLSLYQGGYAGLYHNDSAWFDNFKVYGPHVAGDVNDDGLVDGQDINLILDNWGTGTTREQGDLVDDDVIDNLDVLQVKANWGVGLVPPEPPEGTIPEPATLAILGLATLGFFVRRRGIGKWASVILLAVMLNILSVGTASAVVYGSDDFDRADASDLGASWGYFSNEGNPANPPYLEQADPTFAISSNVAQGIDPPDSTLDNPDDGVDNATSWFRSYYKDYELFSGGSPPGVITVEMDVRSGSNDGPTLHQSAAFESGWGGWGGGYTWYQFRCSYRDSPGDEYGGMSIGKMSSGATLDGISVTGIAALEALPIGTWVHERVTTDNAGHLTFEVWDLAQTTLYHSISWTDPTPYTGGYAGMGHTYANDKFDNFMIHNRHGDVNGDEVVDNLDATTIIANWGTGTTRAQGDLVDDDVINILDLQEVKANWGLGIVPPQPPEGVIPEPATAMLMVLGSIVMLKARSSRRVR